MDERTFQHELQQVKMKVSTMLNRHHVSPHLPPATTSLTQPQTVSELPDNFNVQMSTIPPQLVAFDNDYVSTCQKDTGTHDLKGKDSATGRSRSMHLMSPLAPVAMPPTVTGFGDEHTSNNFVTSLGYTSSHPSNDIDSLDESQYTPESSVGSCEAGLDKTKPHSPTALVPEHCQFRVTGIVEQDVDGPFQHPTTRSQFDQISPQTLHPGSTSKPDRYLECEYGRQIEQLQTAVRELQRTSQPTVFHRSSLEKSAGCRYCLKSGRADASTDCHNPWSTWDSIHQHLQTFQQQHHKDITDLYKHVMEMQTAYTLPARKDINDACVQPSTSSEGIAFRDKEIARLDELLRNTQDRLKDSDRHRAEQHETFTVLASNHERCDDRMDNMLSNILQKHRALISTQKTLAAKEADIRKLQSMLDDRHDTIEAWSRSYRHLEEELHDCQADRDYAVQQGKRLTNMLRESEDRERDCIESHVDEIDRLHGFCKDKDSIADKQELIIVRGAALLEQRDDEIENLTRCLHKAEKALDDERVQTVNLVNHWEKIDQALTTMKSEIVGICTRPKLFTGFGTQVADLQCRLEDISSLMAGLQPYSGASYDDGKSANLKAVRFGTLSHPDGVPTSSSAALIAGNSDQSSMWSPQPIVGLRNLADEERWASIWASNYSPPVFGQPVVIGSSKHDMGRRTFTDDDDDADYIKNKHAKSNDLGPMEASISSESVRPQLELVRKHEQGREGAVSKRESLGSRDIEATPQWSSTNAGRPRRSHVRQPTQQEQQPYQQPTTPSATPASVTCPRLHPFVSHTAMRTKPADENKRPISRQRSVPELSLRSLAATVESEPESNKGGE